MTTNGSPNDQFEHMILNDSSFAATTTPDGSRHVFYQDSSFNLRRAVYSDATRSWSTSTSQIIPNATDARPKTPLSASITNTRTDTSQLTLLYISKSNHLVVTSFAHGVWSDQTTYYNVSQFLSSTTSRSLSLFQVPSTNGSDELLLFFENSEGNVTGLRGTHNELPFFDPASWYSWDDITNALQPEPPYPPATLSPPFSAGLDLYSSLNSDRRTLTTSIVPVAFFFDPHAGANHSVVGSTYINGSFLTCRFPTL